jgi:hypothetical protein
MRMILTVFALLAAAMAAPASAQSRSDFAYQTSDPRVLVFDDGKATRIQLPAGVMQPTVLGIKAQGEVLLPVQQQLPYLASEGVYQQLVLRWGNGQQVTVQYTGTYALDERKGSAVAYGAAAPQQTYAVAARPIQAGTLANMQAGLQQVSMAVTPTRPAPYTPPVQPIQPVQPTAPLFDFRVSDGSMSGTVRRWAEKEAYELVWDLPVDLDPAIARAATLAGAGTLTQALELLIKGMQAKGYPVTAHIYTDRVIHFRLNDSTAKA